MHFGYTNEIIWSNRVKSLTIILHILTFQIRYFLCLVVLCLAHFVSPYSPFRFRFRAFPESSSATTSNLMSPSNAFRLHKRNYLELQCQGMYDPSIFAKLAGICDDCYNLIRDPEIHGMCRLVATKICLIFSKTTPARTYFIS